MDRRIAFLSLVLLLLLAQPAVAQLASKLPAISSPDGTEIVAVFRADCDGTSSTPDHTGCRMTVTQFLNPSLLNAVDSPSDAECLAYDAGTQRFEWLACGSGAGDSITVNSSAGTDPDFLDGDIDWTLSGGNSITGTVACTGCVGTTDIEDGSVAAGDLDTNYESELTNSAGLLAALSDETGTGVSVFDTAPTITSPIFTTSLSLGDPTPIGDADLYTASGNMDLYLRSETDDTYLRLRPGEDGTSEVAGVIFYDGSTAKWTARKEAGNEDFAIYNHVTDRDEINIDSGTGFIRVGTWVKFFNTYGVVIDDFSGVSRTTLTADAGDDLYLGNTAFDDMILRVGSLDPAVTISEVTGNALFAGALSVAPLTNCDTIDTDANGLLSCGTDATGAGGSAITLDLGDDAGDDSVDLNEIATTGDTNSIFTESAADKLLIAVGNNWPIADLATTATTANAGDSATAFFSSGEIADAQVSDTLTCSALSTTAGIADVTVTATELEELATIGATVISAADWTAVAAMSGVNTGDDSGTDDQTAVEVPYTPTTGTDWTDPDPTEVLGGLDDLAGRLTTEETKADDDTPESGDFGNAAELDSTGAVDAVHSGSAHHAIFAPTAGVSTDHGAKAVAVADLADGTDGELITWSATGVAATVAVGTATHVLTSNGVGAAPTFQAAPGGAPATADISDVSVTQTELAELETIGATTISANQWAALGGIAETLAAAELDLLDGITVLSGSNTGDQDLADTVAEITDLDNDAATLSLPANTTITTFGESVVDDADAATARTTLGVDAAGTDNSTNVTLAGTPDYLTLSGQQITRGTIDIGDDTNLAAGRSLTLTGDSPAADAELYTWNPPCVTISDPATDDEFYTVMRAAEDITITEIYCEVIGGTSCQFDFEIDDGTPTGVNGSAITCTTSGVTDSTLGGDTSFADGNRLDVDLGTCVGTNTQASFCIEGTYDD